MIILWDLDHTVIDSSHRQCTLPNGNLDLAHWKENCTPEKIARDTVLPLAVKMRQTFANSTQAICTARVMSAADVRFLKSHNLPYHALMSRAPDDNRADAEYKYSKIWNYLHSLRIPRARWGAMVRLYDDNDSVLEMARSELKIQTVDAKLFHSNHSLKQA